jgi:acetylglutamate kinase
MTREEILKGAGKYIEQFKGRIFVVKYGGSILDDEDISDSILDDIICLHDNGINVALVHGGGSAISRLMKEKGKEPRFVNGLRITDEETAEIVDDALSGINENLAKKIKIADSLISKNKSVIRAKRKDNAPCGDFIGDVASVETKAIKDSFNKRHIPVISPVGIGDDKRPYNINADSAAAETAAALGAEKFIILTNVRGVMTDMNNDKSLISHIDEDRTKELIASNIISGGMIPKVEAGILALDKGVKKIHIISGRIKHALLLEVFTDEGIGTEIIK